MPTEIWRYGFACGVIVGCDHVVLSPEGRRELQRLKNKRGIVTACSPSTCTVEWGKSKEVWLNHPDNLQLEKS